MSSNKTRKDELDTWFDRLPNEIILDIFDYLSSNDILYSFFDFNQRFTHILIQHQRLTRSLELPILNLDYWKKILTTMGSQIQTLVITNDHLPLPLNFFTHLQSLIISSPDYFHFNQLKLILESGEFKTLNSLKINSKLMFGNQYNLFSIDQGHYTLEKIFNNENTLETFELTQIPIGEITIDTLTINLNLHSLTLKLYCFYIIFDIIQFAPNLEYLNLVMKSPPRCDDRKQCPNLSHISLKKLLLKFQSEYNGYYYNTSGITLQLLIDFIKQFSSSLKCLSLDLLQMTQSDASGFRFNGIKLQEELLESMTQLEKFQLYSWIPYCKINDESINILSTFQNQFWFDHHWILGKHERYLYTLPFPHKHLRNFTDFDRIQSSNEEFLHNNPCVWYNVTSIALMKSCKINLNLLKLFKIKMPKLTSITVYGDYSLRFQPTTDPNINENESDNFDVTLDNVTTVELSGEFTENEKQRLIYALPNLTQLALYHSLLPSPESQLALVLGKKIRRLHVTLRQHTSLRNEIIEPDYFSNLEYLNITIDLSSPYKWLCERANNVIYLLEDVETLKVLSIDFIEMEPYYTPRGIANSRDLFKSFHLYEIMKSYEMTHFMECTKFTRKT